jgi:hypothetical protein
MLARAGCSLGAWAKKVWKSDCSAIWRPSSSWLKPVSQKMISSTSAFVRPFLSAFAT